MVLSPRYLLHVLFCVAILCCDVAALDFDQFDRFCPQTTNEKLVLEDAADGQLDGYSMLRAALICAGRDESTIQRCERAFAAEVARCRPLVHQALHANGVTKSLFRRLRTDFLHGVYSPDLYDLSATILHGEYNCLTATILFQALCSELGLPVHALWEPSHVRCWVAAEGGRGIPIETTAASLLQAIGPPIAFQDLPDRCLCRTELLGKVLYNRGVQALRKEDYPQALSATWSSYLLDLQDGPAFSNLRACLNNWALLAFESGQTELAKTLLDEGIQIDPDYQPFQRNRTLISPP